MFSLHDLRFVFCSRDLDVLGAQRIIAFFILITHKPTKSKNPIIWSRTSPIVGFITMAISTTGIETGGCHLYHFGNRLLAVSFFCHVSYRSRSVSARPGSHPMFGSRPTLLCHVGEK